MSKSLLSFFLLLSFLSNGQAIEGLVAKYSFNDNNGKDEVGKNNAKIYNVLKIEDRFGNPNFACYMLGNAESFINLGTGNILKPKKGSVSIWVNLYSQMAKGFGVEANTIIYTRAHNEDDFNEAYGISYDINTKHIMVFCSLSERNAAAAFSLGKPTLVEWYHVVFTYDNNFLTCYINGILQTRVVKDFETEFLEGDSVIVGNRVSRKNTRFFHGCVDDIQIYNKVLSLEEIKTLYHEPNPNKFKIILSWILYALAGIVIILLILWLIRWRIAKGILLEREKNQLQNDWYEQENRVLTAQMDPHFIFNSLNTIQQFIIINDNEKAQLYLSKFSRLIRKMLENNTKKSVSLKDEVEIFEKYLEIESLRFNNVFNYTIEIAKNIESEKIKIPHFLIQPIIENAIWHGLLPKDGDKQLTISFEKTDEETLACTIDDNGVGRKYNKSSDAFDKRKSLAINFIRQRLQMMSKIKKRNYDITIIDKINDAGESKGTRVIITIPILNDEI